MARYEEVLAVYDVGLVQVIPLAPSIVAAPRVTLAVTPEEQVSAVTEPFAQ